jgi:hypothetical protein
MLQWNVRWWMHHIWWIVFSALHMFQSWWYCHINGVGHQGAALGCPLQEDISCSHILDRNTCCAAGVPMVTTCTYSVEKRQCLWTLISKNYVSFIERYVTEGKKYYHLASLPLFTCFTKLLFLDTVINWKGSFPLRFCMHLIDLNTKKVKFCFKITSVLYCITKVEVHAWWFH